MKSNVELLLNFLLNACWQIMLMASVTALADLLLRRTAARYRHLLWVAALLLSLTLPIVTSIRPLFTTTPAPVPQEVAPSSVAVVDLNQTIPAAGTPTVAGASTPALEISVRIATALLAFYLIFLCYRTLRFLRACARTQAVRRGVAPFGPAHRIHAILSDCQRAIGVHKVTIRSSFSLSVPATIGIFRPVIILPLELARQANNEELTAAVGHELVHVRRHDYLLNLIYELVFLPLSFHPAAALMRRRITQTRELRCDELVAELLLRPEVYARSLVQLARSVMPPARRTRTVAVGITDADILEVRVMSLLKRTKLQASKRKVWLIAAALLLAIPCAAAPAFAFHLHIDTARAQEPSREEQEERETRARREQEIKEKMQHEMQELETAIKNETNAEVKAKLERRLAEFTERMAKPTGMVVTTSGENYVMVQVDEGRAREEREQEERRKAILAQMAKLTMDQAIQIATSQTPGKVLECSLVGEHWEAPGKLAKDSQVMYHVVILSGDDAKPTTTHVLVNAIDGTIFKSSNKELREKIR